jgi:hypothetical protein
MKHKLLHYFESHLISVVTSFWLGEIVENHLTMGRIAKWALKLMGLDITYMPQMAIKSQALADFCGQMDQYAAAPPSLKSTRVCISMSLSPSMESGEAWC